MTHTIDTIPQTFVSTFVRDLFQGDKRIVFNPMGINDNDDQFFRVTKTAIHIPYCLPSIEHEIAHAVEMSDKSRWLLPDWGIPFGPKWNTNMTGSRLFGAMAREIRVRAIQSLMLNNGGEEGGTTRNILNNNAWSEWVNGCIPFGRFGTRREVVDWVNDLRDKTLKRWSLERIRHEWMIRFDHMREFMETS